MPGNTCLKKSASLQFRKPPASAACVYRAGCECVDLEQIRLKNMPVPLDFFFFKTHFLHLQMQFHYWIQECMWTRTSRGRLNYRSQNQILGGFHTYDLFASVQISKWVDGLRVFPLRLVGFHPKCRANQKSIIKKTSRELLASSSAADHVVFEGGERMCHLIRNGWAEFASLHNLW